MSYFKTIGLIGKYRNEESSILIEKLANWLRDQNVVVRSISGIHHSDSATIKAAHALGAHCDLIIILGGDGTFLSAARELHTYNVPLLGVNMGRLGFLADLSQDHLDIALIEILNGQFMEEPRLLLNADIHNLQGAKTCSLALNEVVIHQADVARMIQLDVYVNDQFLTSYWADGLIISTPTGSTAYALSTGGPLIYPTLPAILIAPICPHTFSHRPIVIPADSRLRISLAKNPETAVKVTCDGQKLMPFEFGALLNISSAPDMLHLIHPREYNYFGILRAKLNWGHRPTHER